MRWTHDWDGIAQKITLIKGGTVDCGNNAKRGWPFKCFKGTRIMSIKAITCTTVNQQQLNGILIERERNCWVAQNHQEDKSIIQKIWRRSIIGDIDSQRKVRLAGYCSWTKKWRYPSISRKIFEFRVSEKEIGRKNKKVVSRAGESHSLALAIATGQ